MGTKLALNFRPATGFDVAGMLYSPRSTLASLEADGAAKYFAAFDKISACFKEAATLTLDQLTAGEQSTLPPRKGGAPVTWTNQDFSHVYKDAKSGLAQAILKINVKAQTQVPASDPGTSYPATFALLTVSIEADDRIYELGVEVQAIATELAKVAGTTAVSVVLFKLARAGGRALWNAFRNVWRRSVQDDSILGESSELLGATEGAVDEELAGDVLAESMVEMEALTEVAGIVSTAGPVAVPIAIMLGMLLLIGLLFRKKVTIITHEIHLMDTLEHTSFMMNLPANSNSQMIQYPSRTSDSSTPLAQNYQPVLPFPSRFDIASDDFSSDSDVVATAIFKFTNTDHRNPPQHSFFLSFPSSSGIGAGYQLCFKPEEKGKIRTYIAGLPSIDKAERLPADGNSAWQTSAAALEPTGTAPPITFRDETLSRPITITLATSYSHTPSSGKDHPETYAYRTLVLLEEDPIRNVEA